MSPGVPLSIKVLAAKAVGTAIEAGYWLIDTAALYGNEKEVGEGIGDWSDIFRFFTLIEALPNPITVEKSLFRSRGGRAGESRWEGNFSITVLKLKKASS